MTELVDALYIDGVRLPIGRVRPDGFYSRIRADDMAVRAVERAGPAEAARAGRS